MIIYYSFGLNNSIVLGKAQGWLLMRGGFQSYYSSAGATKRHTSTSFVFHCFCNDF